MSKPAPDSTGLRLEAVENVVERVVEDLKQRGDTRNFLPDWLGWMMRCGGCTVGK